MPVGRKYTVYRRIVEEKLGLRQLDVYRFKDRDVLRVATRDGKVVLLELEKKRDEYTPEEFEQALRAKLEQALRKG